MPIYPYYTPPTITATTFASVGWFNELQDNIQRLLIDIYKAKGTKTNLNSFIKSFMTSLGLVKTNAVSHIKMINITPDQHHAKYHGDTHANNQDNIPFTTSTKHGLARVTDAIKIYNIASKASRHRITTLIYRGNGSSAGKFITLGYSPNYVAILYDPSHFMCEGIDVASKNFQTAWIDHTFRGLVSSFRITVNGIKVFASCNKTMSSGTASCYYVFAIRGD